MGGISVSGELKGRIKGVHEDSPEYYATTAVEDLERKICEVFVEKEVADKLNGAHKFYIINLSDRLYELFYTMFCLGYHTEITFRKRGKDGGKD